MKKVAYAVLILTMAVFLMNPLPSEARGGPGGGHGGGHWGGGGHGGWWVPWAILGTISILAPYFSSPPVIAREQPPVNQPAPSVTPSLNEKIFVYPRQGQSEELQAKDREECQSWAASQTGYEPTKSPTGDMPEALRNQIRADYQRAQSACLEGRGYTVR